MNKLDVLLMAALLGCSGSDNGGDAEDVCDYMISLIDYKLVPAEIDAEAGTIVLCAKNDGKAPHDLAVRDDSDKVLGRTEVLDPGEQDQFSLELSAGAFDIFCSVAGHESLGMKGTLTVQ
jgi:plastocyanin